MGKEIDLISAPKKSFWKLSLPIILFCLFDAIYGIVDMVWVSNISIEAFFAMGISIPFVTFVFSVGDSIGQGTNSIMSRFIGSGDYESAYNALIHGMVSCNVIWFIIVLCFLFANGILFQVYDENSYISILDYLFPIIIFAYVFIFNNLFSETLQAEGNSRTPTMLIIASNILNLVLDPIFIFNLNLGVKGAAYATVLSAFIVFFPILYLYYSGRTKVPLSLKYFKFRQYIFVEIFKVALPNFFDNALWLLSATFTNSALIIAMDSMGPILYTVSSKIKNLLAVPIRGYGRALMSITGHLFGARKFDEINCMFRYVLKVSFFTIIGIIILFFIMREHIFSFFSITGMQTEIFWIAIIVVVVMFSTLVSMNSAKMLDGLGKSMYSLLFTAVKVCIEIGLIFLFMSLMDKIIGILLAIVINEIIMAIIYYLFLRYLLGNFNREYEGKSTVKTFTDKDGNIDGVGSDEKTWRSRVPNILKRWGMVIFLTAMIIAFLLIVSMTVIFHGNSTLGGIAAVTAVGIISYFLKRLARTTFHIIELIVISFMLFLLAEFTNHMSTIIFILIGILLIYILSTLRRIFKKV